MNVFLTEIAHRINNSIIDDKYDNLFHLLVIDSTGVMFMAATCDDVIVNCMGSFCQQRQLSYTSIFSAFGAPARYIIRPSENPIQIVRKYQQYQVTIFERIYCGVYGSSSDYGSTIRGSSKNAEGSQQMTNRCLVSGVPRKYHFFCNGCKKQC